MDKIRLAAFDLDNTLLDREKRISGENLNAIRTAVSLGIEMVPATGRLYNNIPPELKELCRYYILSNGATIYDSKSGEYFCDALIPQALALELFVYADSLSCIYDCYVGNCAYMSVEMHTRIDDYAPDSHHAQNMKVKRTPVSDLKMIFAENSQGVQKFQYYFGKNISERDRQMDLLTRRYPGLLALSTSLTGNLEINCADAHKGAALLRLCDRLGISPEQTAAFGDGTNDLTMLREAGTGVCMKNGAPECLEAADLITELDCDHSGFARALLGLINYQEN